MIGGFYINKIIKEISSLKTPVDIYEFAANRVAHLEQNTPECEISGAYEGSQLYKGYINMNSKIYASFILLPPFYMDDFNMYVNFLNFVNKEFGLHRLSSFDLKTIITLIQMFIEITFKSYGSKKADREDVYDENERHVSIRHFYGNGSAKCVEKSAAVQNLLAFLGIESFLAFNKVSISYDNSPFESSSDDGHVIVIVKKDDKLLAYDPKNMISCIRNGRKIYLPALVELSQKDIADVREVTMESKDTARIYGLDPSDSKTRRKYTLF